MAAAARARCLLGALGEAPSMWPSPHRARQGSSEGHFSCTRLIKGLVQLPASAAGKKELVWDCLQEPLLQNPAAKAVLPPYISLFIP